MSTLTHFDEYGQAQMVDVSAKAPTQRFARARGRVLMRQETLARIQDRTIEKGDVFGVARVAAILAAKQTGNLIPMCHPLGITAAEVHFTPLPEESAVEIEVRVSTMERTGVEMEALIAVSVAALTIYDMCKAIDRGMTISAIQLLEKRGGKSGTWLRDSA